MLQEAVPLFMDILKSWEFYVALVFFGVILLILMSISSQEMKKSNLFNEGAGGAAGPQYPNENFDVKEVDE